MPAFEGRSDRLNAGSRSWPAPSVTVNSPQLILRKLTGDQRVDDPGHHLDGGNPPADQGQDVHGLTNQGLAVSKHVHPQSLVHGWLRIADHDTLWQDPGSGIWVLASPGCSRSCHRAWRNPLDCVASRSAPHRDTFLVGGEPRPKAGLDPLPAPPPGPAFMHAWGSRSSVFAYIMLRFTWSACHEIPDCCGPGADYRGRPQLGPGRLVQLQSRRGDLRRRRLVRESALYPGRLGGDIQLRVTEAADIRSYRHPAYSQNKPPRRRLDFSSHGCRHLGNLGRVRQRRSPPRQARQPWLNCGRGTTPQPYPR